MQRHPKALCKLTVGYKTRSLYLAETRAFLGYGAGEEQYKGNSFVQKTNGSS